VRTYVYIDGFNLYYGALKGTAYKWLNVEAMISKVLRAGHCVNKIRYFTAKVDPRANDPDQPIRQLAYLSALETIPTIEVHFGTFLTRPVSLPTEESIQNPPLKFARVMRSEEKGSDVNLAAYLLMDGFEHGYDCAVIVSNDSDLLTPIKMVRNRLKKTVGLVPPRRRGSTEMKLSVDFVREIREHHLRDSQFPAQLEHGARRITKPVGW